MADCGIAVFRGVETDQRCVALGGDAEFTGDGRYVDGCCGCVQLGQAQ